MRCTSCSEIVRPVVLVDIDGTIANYHDHLIKFVCKYLNAYPPPGEGGFTGDREIDEWLGIPKQLYREAKLAFRQGGMKRTMPVYRGAQSMMAELRKAGLEIWITTTRPWMRLDSVDPDTREWLGRNCIDYDHLLYDDDKYKKVTEIVDQGRIVGVVEDLPEQFDRAQELGLGPVQRWTRYNSSVRREPGSESLLTIAKIMTMRAEEWMNERGATQSESSRAIGGVQAST